jgi:integrase
MRVNAIESTVFQTGDSKVSFQKFRQFRTKTGDFRSHLFRSRARRQCGFFDSQHLLLHRAHMGDFQPNQPALQSSAVASDRRRKGKSMSRRSGQKGQVVKKGLMWHVRYYVDIPHQETRQRKSVPVGYCAGKEKITKAEAQRKGTEIINSLGVNTAEHLQQATKPTTFKDRVAWCRINKQAWLRGKPGPILTMESQLKKHILPRLGDLPLHMVDETRVQEFIAYLQRTTFELRRKDKLIKTYTLSAKTILNIVGVVKLVMGEKVWRDWDLDMPEVEEKDPRYFNEDELRRIIGKATGQYKVLFALLAGTGMRIGEAAGLYVEDVDVNNCVIFVRHSVWNGQDLKPKTKKSVRVIDIHPGLAEVLRVHMGERKSGRLFTSQTGSPISGNNILKRVLHPLLAELQIKKAGLHAFRHSRVTILRKNGTPEHLQLQWIGHSSLRTTDRYSHTDQEVEYRRAFASKEGLNVVVGPNGPN